MVLKSESEYGTAPDDDTRRLLLHYARVARGIEEETYQLQKQGALDLRPSCRGQQAARVAPHSPWTPPRPSLPVPRARGR
ncbi:hypothetical protein [Streptomyces albipurpureus]|uniref:Uncharacterized protein n=1 Tax=Streptomyces albipurpureus TaxID=2897419 RepID=A0ABT0UG99_9ACTN|nr:hypothetical protein [Streptomyces sp. CWNU-1]MCM2387657.1 hypothetical protein [Streptomyces sp. CWNU-1]